MACRDTEKADAALKEVKDASGNQDVVTSRLDLADSKSIREFAENINKGEITRIWYKVLYKCLPYIGLQ